MLHCPKRKMPISGLQWLDIQSVGLSQCTDLEMDYDTDTKSENNFLLKHKSLSRLERNVPAISNRSKRLWISWFSVGRFFFYLILGAPSVCVHLSWSVRERLGLPSMCLLTEVTPPMFIWMIFRVLSIHQPPLRLSNVFKNYLTSRVSNNLPQKTVLPL